MGLRMQDGTLHPFISFINLTFIFLESETHSSLWLLLPRLLTKPFPELKQGKEEASIIENLKPQQEKKHECVCSGHYNKYHRLGGLNIKCWCLTVPDVGASKIPVSACLDCWLAFSVCPHMTEREHVCKPVKFFFYKAPTASKPNDFLKASPHRTWQEDAVSTCAEHGQGRRLTAMQITNSSDVCGETTKCGLLVGHGGSCR